MEASPYAMDTARLEAFSDAVIAIIITIMVLGLEPPRSTDLASLRPLLPAYVSYALSFVYLGIYWNNHHHMFQITERVSGSVLWANLHLLFWLSLIPFVTGWMGENRFASVPTALYGVDLLLAAVAYWILEHAILAEEGPDSLLGMAVGTRLKENVSLLVYAIAIPAAFLRPWIAGALYAAVALIWVIPDRRVERALAEKRRREQGQR